MGEWTGYLNGNIVFYIAFKGTIQLRTAIRVDSDKEIRNVLFHSILSIMAMTPPPPRVPQQ